MKSSFLRVAALAALASSIGYSADAPVIAPVTFGKMPVLNKDFSPINDGKGPMISSYADIVEPVEKEVVSITSSRTVHEHVEANPLLKQFFDVPFDERSDNRWDISRQLDLEPIASGPPTHDFERVRIDGRQAPHYGRLRTRRCGNRHLIAENGACSSTVAK